MTTNLQRALALVCQVLTLDKEYLDECLQHRQERDHPVERMSLSRIPNALFLHLIAVWTSEV